MRYNIDIMFDIFTYSTVANITIQFDTNVSRSTRPDTVSRVHSY